MSNARLALVFMGETALDAPAPMLGQPPGFPRLLPLVRFADTVLRASFPTPLHASGQWACL